MNTIKQYLLEIRYKTIKADIKIIAWQVYSLSIILFLTGIILENIFYISAQIRFAILISIAIIFMVWSLITYLKIKNNHFKRYQLEFLARKVGVSAFPKADTLINAFQIEQSNKTVSSKDLGNAFINQSIKTLSSFDQTLLFPSKKINLWKKITLLCLIITISTIGISWQYSVSSMYRWAHSKTIFIPPKPFELFGITRHVNVLGGDNIDLTFKSKGEIPDSIFIEFKPQIFNGEKDSSIIVSTLMSNINEYKFEFKNVFQNFRYRAFYPSTKIWEPWDEVTTKYYSISVTDRPSIQDFLIIISPPAYTGLPKKTQKANQAEVQVIKGSNISIQLKTNKELVLAQLILDEQKNNMKISGGKAKYDFIAISNKQFSILLTDKRGVTNRNPIPFNIEIVNDLLPNMAIIQPPPIIELGGEQKIPIIMTIEDDFGFSNLQLAYEIQRPSYIQVEPLISLFSIPITDMTLARQEIQTFWDLQALSLMPEDEVHFHFELYDNDIITGPKKILSSSFIARLPSLNDLFQTFNNKEEKIIDTVQMELKDLQKLKNQLEKAKLDLLKKDKTEWEDQKVIKEALETTQEKLEDFKDLVKQIDELNSNGEKHQLFSKDLMEKFESLQKLVEEIFPPEMLKNMDWMNEALEKMDPNELLTALDKLSKNIQQVEKELDRFLDIFKRVKAEQQVDELRKRLEQLVKNQDKIDQQIRQTDSSTRDSIFERLSLEQKISKRELSEINNAMTAAAKNVKIFSRKTAQSLEDLSNSELSKSSENHLEKTIKSLNNKDSYKAMDESYAGIKDMQKIEQEMIKILNEFQKETTRDMSQKFRFILKDLLTISKSQESLRNQTKEIPRNSPRLNKLAIEQQMMQNQLTQTMKNAISLSKETFLVSPEMGKKLGLANAQMNAAKRKLSERNGNGSLNNQSQAITALNEGSKIIIQTIKQMQEKGSASGYSEFLKQMQEMAGKQKGVNDQGMQLALGQMANSLKESIMKQILSQQKNIRQSLKKMLNEMNKSGKNGLGDLSGIANEMDKVIKDIEENKYDKTTAQKQNQILSRMINSQISITERGFEDKRESITGEQSILENSTKMPLNLGQRESIIINAMNKALNSGYSQEYKNMIRRYFNSINQIQNNLFSDSTQVKSVIEGKQ